MPWIIQLVVIGFAVGLAAKFLTPGPKRPSGFILTTALGIAGAYLATLIGRAVHWLETNEIAGILEMIAGAIVVTFIWNRLVAHGVIRNWGSPTDRDAPTR